MKNKNQKEIKCATCGKVVKINRYVTKESGFYKCADCRSK